MLMVGYRQTGWILQKPTSESKLKIQEIYFRAGKCHNYVKIVQEKWHKEPVMKVKIYTGMYSSKTQEAKYTNTTLRYNSKETKN